MAFSEGGQSRHWVGNRQILCPFAGCLWQNDCVSPATQLAVASLMCVFVVAVAQMKNVACRQILERFRFNLVNVANTHLYTYIFVHIQTKSTNQLGNCINWPTFGEFAARATSLGTWFVVVAACVGRCARAFCVIETPLFMLPCAVAVKLSVRRFLSQQIRRLPSERLGSCSSSAFNAAPNAALLDGYRLALIWRSLAMGWLACASLGRCVAIGNARVGWRIGPLIVSSQMRQMRWPHCHHHYHHHHQQPRQALKQQQQPQQ